MASWLVIELIAHNTPSGSTCYISLTLAHPPLTESIPVRVSPKLKSDLRKLADERSEGKLSREIRRALQDHVEREKAAA